MVSMLYFDWVFFYCKNYSTIAVDLFPSMVSGDPVLLNVVATVTESGLCFIKILSSGHLDSF